MSAPGSTAPATPPPGAPLSLQRQRVRAAWLMLLPALVALAAMAGWPLVRTFWFALTDARLDGLEEVRFVGLENFRLVLEDPDWWQSVRNTLRFTVVSVGLETVLGMGIALVLNTRFRGRGVLRAAVLVPWAIPTVVSARMWGWMFHDVYGVLNALLQGVGLISEPVAWTADPVLAQWALVAVDVWKTTPFMALLLLAALQVLPEELYEAARMDGASPVRTFFQVTLPLIRGPLLVAVIFRTLDALRVFDLFYVLTSNSSDSMSMAVYARQQMFEFQDLGLGAAAASLLFAMIALFTGVYMVVGRVGRELEAP